VLVCKISDALTERFNARTIIKHVTKHVGGNGGGSARFAQGGGSQPGRLAEALEEGTRLIKSKVQGPKPKKVQGGRSTPDFELSD
ncbi:MAG: DHHA1 domain-containing protein, partial [Candidatus Bipolaricaulia bacterium]